jgi:hypothetical protein
VCVCVRAQMTASTGMDVILGCNMGDHSPKLR